MSDWPALPPLSDWEPTRAALHLWSQVVGKVRLAHTPWINHSWHVPLYVTVRGLTTGPVAHGARAFEVTLDLLNGRLVIETAGGERRERPLQPESVADFYAGLLEMLDDLDLHTDIDGVPNEVDPAVPFARDTDVRPYDASAARAYWQALVQAQRVFTLFRARFQGKVSPVHLFWGGFDLAVTRFSGRAAPPHPGGVPNLPDAVTREAYSHEVSSAGLWPGDGPDGGLGEAHVYSYAYPTPEGFSGASVQPAEARWDRALGEFVLPYEAVRTAADPDAALLAFLQSTYEAAADLAGWNREALAFPGLAAFE